MKTIDLQDLISGTVYTVQTSQITATFKRKISVNGGFYDVIVVRLSCGLEIHVQTFDFSSSN